MPEYVVRPVTSENWADFAALFEACGGPHYCWCTIHLGVAISEQEEHFQ
jgi:hypothetical protein